MLPQKNHPKDILHDKNHLYRIVLVNLTLNDAFNVFRWLHIEFLKSRKNLKFHLSASLPDYIHKPRRQMKHRRVAILRHNNKLTSEMCLLGFQRVWGLCASLLLLSSIRLFFFFMQRNHIDVLIFPINTFLEQCI